MGKLPEKFEDWRLPWKEDEFDSDRAARMVFKLKQSFEELQGTVKERDEQIATLTADLDEAKAAKSGTDEDAQAELKELRKENRKLKEESSEAKSLPADEKKIWQYEAALELGLTAAQARRLQGDDAEAIKEDAKSFAEELGIELDGGDQGQGDAGENGGNQTPPPVQQPSPRYKTGSNGADRINVVSDPAGAAAKLPPLFA